MTPLERAIRAGCRAACGVQCDYPTCDCRDDELVRVTKIALAAALADDEATVEAIVDPIAELVCGGIEVTNEAALYHRREHTKRILRSTLAALRRHILGEGP